MPISRKYLSGADTKSVLGGRKVIFSSVYQFQNIILKNHGIIGNLFST